MGCASHIRKSRALQLPQFEKLNPTRHKTTRVRLCLLDRMQLITWQRVIGLLF